MTPESKYDSRDLSTAELTVWLSPASLTTVASVLRLPRTTSARLFRELSQLDFEFGVRQGLLRDLLDQRVLPHLFQPVAFGAECPVDQVAALLSSPSQLWGLIPQQPDANPLHATAAFAALRPHLKFRVILEEETSNQPSLRDLLSRQRKEEGGERMRRLQDWEIIEILFQVVLSLDVLRCGGVVQPDLTLDTIRVANENQPLAIVAYGTPFFYTAARVVRFEARGLRALTRDPTSSRDTLLRVIMAQSGLRLDLRLLELSNFELLETLWRMGRSEGGFRSLVAGSKKPEAKTVWVFDPSIVRPDRAIDPFAVEQLRLRVLRRVLSQSKRSLNVSSGRPPLGAKQPRGQRRLLEKEKRLQNEQRFADRVLRQFSSRLEEEDDDLVISSSSSSSSPSPPPPP